MVLVQKWPFFQLFVLCNKGQQNIFYDILERKIAFLGYKNKKFKKLKNRQLSKGVNPWFWSKYGHCSNFFFLSNKDQENVFYDIQERKIAFLGYKNKKFKKLKNRQLSKGVNPWFWSKNGHYSNFLFQAKKDQENVFYDILERKIAFLGYKNKKFKNSKNFHFSKAVNPWFWSKNGHFSNCLFYATKASKISFTIIQNEKLPFQAIKTRRSKSRKIDNFPKGLTLGFGPKMAIFPTFFFRQKRQGNCLLRYSRRKIAFLGYKNKTFKKSKNFHFSKGVNPRFWCKNGHFSNFFFLDNIRQENVFYDILERKIAFLGNKNKKLKQSKN